MSDANEGTLKTDGIAVATGAGTSPQVLFSYGVPKGFFLRKGQALCVKIFGINAANAHLKTIVFKFGSTTLLTYADASAVAGNWSFEATIINNGVSSQVAECMLSDSDDNNYGPSITNPTEDTLNTSPAISVTATDAVDSAGDVTYKGCTIELLQDNAQN